MDKSGRRECRYHRTPKLTASGAGNQTCEKGIAYVDLLPTPEARGSGWVRRLPCVQLGSLSRLPGGSECPHYVEKTEYETFAAFEPLRSIGKALGSFSSADIRALNADKTRLAAFMAEHGEKPRGQATLVPTADHVALRCACGAFTDQPRHPEVAPLTCAACGKGYELSFVPGIGDYRLSEKK